MFSSTSEGAYWRGGLIERGRIKFSKYEQIFYGDIMCIFQSSSPITILLWFVAVLKNIIHTKEVYAPYDHNLSLALFAFLRRLNRKGDLIHFSFCKGGLLERGAILRGEGA